MLQEAGFEIGVGGRVALKERGHRAGRIGDGVGPALGDGREEALDDIGVFLDLLGRTICNLITEIQHKYPV